MKHVQQDKIINISDEKPNTFLFEFLNHPSGDVRVVYMADELEKYKNSDLLEQVKTKPAMWGNVYSPKDELTIFEKIFTQAIETQTPVHIVWITLKQELEILEKYYHEQGYFNEDINCYTPDFSKCLVTASVNIENLIWRWSDYKRMWKKIFFHPPIRESWQVKALFKWINRGVVAWINFWNLSDDKTGFLRNCITEEKILPITLAKVLKYNLESIWFAGDIWNFEVDF